MLATLAFAADVFFANGPYDQAVPTPQAILGYGPGQHHTVYLDQERVVQAIAAKAAGRVKVFPFGKSNEGRPLRVVAISSPENIKHLDQIRADMQTLADGTLNEDVLKRVPCIVWINETIHGNETASFESGMWLIYNLAASRNQAITQTLQNTVVIVNPCYNPDGHERCVVWYNSVARGDADPGTFETHEPRILNGRSNHYRFDMNRDRLAMSQIETQQEVTEFLRWNPQVYADQHGQVETYFFPPTAMSVNANVRERYNKWTDVLGRATAKAFDANGFGYYVKDVFDFYAPVYLDSWATFSGAIGMTQETNTSWLATTDGDGTVWTLRDGVERHFTSALAVIESSSKNREGLLRAFAEYKHKGASGQAAGARKFFVARASEAQQAERLRKTLAVSHIQSEVIEGKGSFSGESLWTGKSEHVSDQGFFLVIPMAQPQATLALSLLQTESEFEPEFIKEQIRRREAQKADSEYAESSEFYDLTGWSISLLHGLRSWWTTEKPSLSPAPKALIPAVAPTVGWAVRPGEANTLAVERLLMSGVRVSMSPKEMKLSTGTYPPGTYIIHRKRNEEDVASKLKGVAVEPLDSAFPEEGRYAPGSENVIRLRPAKIGILYGDENNPTQFGSAWWVFEKEFNLPFTALHNGALRGNLDRFSTILAPEGSVDVSGDKMKEWVQGGGCLVLLGGAPTRGGYLKLEASSGAGSVPGSLFRGELDPRSFISYGYPVDADGKVRLAAFVSGSTFYKADGEGSVFTIPDDEGKKLLTGWEWPDDTEKAIAGTSWCEVAHVGQGRVIWFAQDPTERAMYPGMYGMLLNAMVMGPAP